MSATALSLDPDSFQDDTNQNEFQFNRSRCKGVARLAQGRHRGRSREHAMSEGAFPWT